MKTNIPVFVDHVALGVPMLILTIAKDLNELFQDGGVTAIASLGEFGGVVVVAVYIALVLVVAVLCAEHCRTDRAGKVLDVVFPVSYTHLTLPTKRIV